MCVDGPDNTASLEAARVNERIMNRQLDLQESLIPYYKERQERLDDLTSEATTTQLGIMRQQADQAQDLYEYGKNTFRPVEQSLVAQAMQDSTPEAYARYAAAASARTGQAYRNLSAAADRSARARGLGPRGISRGQMMDMAAASGAAFNDAWDKAEGRGWARRLDAAGLGRGLAGASSAAYAAATGAGSAAAGAANNANQTAGATIGTPTQYGQVGAGFGGNYTSAMNSASANSGGGGLDPGLGALIGMGISRFTPISSKKMKTNKQSMSDDEVLEGIQRTPSEKWNYKEGTIADDGGREHTGPYAEDMHREFGVGDGETLDPMDTAGIALRGVQALTNELQEIKQALGIKRKGGRHGTAAA